MKTASIYIRRSKQSKQGQTISLEFQERQTRELCERLGAEVVRIHVDDGKSGALMNRAAWRKWMADSADVDILAAWAVDRTTRSGLVGGAALIDAINANGARFVSVDGLDSNSSDFELIFGIKCVLAREEWKRASIRNKAVHAEKRARGEYIGAAPFGTRFDGKKLVLDPKESEMVREAASRLLRGDSILSLVRWFNASGVTTRRGNLWSRSGVVNTMSSLTTRDHILGTATWDAIQERVTPVKRGGEARPAGRPPSYALLQRAATCDGCGKGMYTRHNAPDSHAYICRMPQQGRPCPYQGRMLTRLADAEVERLFLERYGDDSWIEEVVEIIGSTVEAAEAALRDAQAALLASPGAETLAAYQAAQTAVETASPGERRRRFVKTETYAEMWRRAGDDLVEKRRILLPSIHEVRIGKGRIASITWRDQINPDSPNEA